MRPLRENERDEIESIKHLIKYSITNPNIKDFEIWKCITELNRIAEKYVLSGIISENELNELTDLDDCKELVDKLKNMIFKHLEREDFS